MRQICFKPCFKPLKPKKLLSHCYCVSQSKTCPHPSSGDSAFAGPARIDRRGGQMTWWNHWVDLSLIWTLHLNHWLAWWLPDILWSRSGAWSRWQTSAASAWSPEPPGVHSGIDPLYSVSTAPEHTHTHTNTHNMNAWCYVRCSSAALMSSILQSSILISCVVMCF